MSYFFAALSGFSIVLSMSQNGYLSQKIGYKNATLMNFVTGLSGSFLILLLSRHIFQISTFLEQAQNIPLLGLIGGCLGVLVVIISNIAIQKIPVISLAMLSYVGQLSCGIVIDLINGIHLSSLKIIGCLLVLAGVLFNHYIDKKTALQP